MVRGEGRVVVEGKNGTEDKFMLANPGRTALFRFRPTVADLGVMAVLMCNNHTVLEPIDRAGVVSDLIALMLSNYVRVEDVLPVLMYLERERSPTVWKVAVKGLGRWLDVMEVHEGYSAVVEFVARLVGPVVESVGWWRECGEGQEEGREGRMLRGVVLPFAVLRVGHVRMRGVAREVFGRWRRDVESGRGVSTCFEVQEDFGVLLDLVYSVAVMEDPRGAERVLRNGTVGFPGGLDTDRLFPFARSAFASQVAMVVGGGVGRGEGGWVERVEAVVRGGRQEGVELAWSLVRWGIVREQRGVERRGEQEVLMVGGEEEGESVWDWIVKEGGLSVQDAVELVVAAAWKDGSVWREAVATVGPVVKGKESPVIVAVRRGLEKANAAGMFRRTLAMRVKD
ncbi:hypothetical protein HDU98_008095 [Podochytrium sp. JEL0797]|nr:hypothetical protein HDU98_008095 [Podochytrium sp. JEL0797]